MENRSKRQANLFEELPRVTELPTLKRGKAIMLLGSLLTEAIANTEERKGGETKQSGEASNDENHG